MTDTARLLLLDAYSLIYRAFFAIPHLTGPHGQPVNALYGFAQMLRKLRTAHQPTHLAAAFDLGPPRQRLAMLPQYKAQRPPTPPDLEGQLPAIRELLAAHRLPVIEREGEEADDIIATLATRAAAEGGQVLIASQDKDLAQLVGPRIVLVRAEGKEPVVWDAATVTARFGVSPAQLVDYLALVGDAVDNIPGVPGIGPKKAAELLRQFGSLDNLLANLPQIANPRLRAALAAYAEQLPKHRALIRLNTQLDLPVRLDDLQCQPPDLTRLVSLYRQYGFKRLLAEVERPTTGELFAQGGSATRPAKPPESL